MPVDLASKFQELELRKRDLLSRVGAYPSSHLHFRPSTEAWSPLGVLDHLVRTESAILAVARKGTEKPRRIGILDRWRTRFLIDVFESQRRVKVPRSASVVLPGENLRFEEIASRWESTRTELAQFLGAAPAEVLEKGIFKHPVGGWMNAGGILDFFSVHIAHHQFQFSRIEEAFWATSDDTGERKSS